MISISSFLCLAAALVLFNVRLAVYSKKTGVIPSRCQSFGIVCGMEDGELELRRLNEAIRRELTRTDVEVYHLNNDWRTLYSER